MQDILDQARDQATGCAAAGYNGCCTGDNCKTDSGCYCDVKCYYFHNCCDDITKVGCYRKHAHYTVRKIKIIIDKLIFFPAVIFRNADFKTFLYEGDLRIHYRILFAYTCILQHAEIQVLDKLFIVTLLFSPQRHSGVNSSSWSDLQYKQHQLNFVVS